MADPSWSSVVTYLRFNSAGSSTVTDEVGGSRTWTMNGGAAQSATGAIKGGSSLRTVGNTGAMYVSSSDNLSDWQFGTGDFTLDVTIQCGEQGPDFFTVLAEADDAWFFRLRWFGRQVEFMGREFDPGAGFLTDGLPHAIRLSRVSGVLYCQIDGRTDMLSPSSYTYTDNLPLPTGKLIGRGIAGDQWFDGVMDEFRVTKGVGRSTGAYTPSAGEFETAGGSSDVLCTLAVTDAADTVAAAAAVAVGAALSSTDAADTLASVGSVQVVATLARTDTEDTLTSSAAASIVAALATTDAADSLAASAVIGTAPVDCALAVTDTADTVSSAAVVAIAASLARTDASDTAASSAVVAIVATLARTDAADTLASTAFVGSAPVTASLAVTDASDLVASAAAVRVTAAASATDANDVFASAALARLLATLAVTDAADLLDSSATTAGPVLVNLAVVDSPDLLSATLVHQADVLGSLIGRTRQAFGVRSSVQTSTRRNEQSSKR